MTINPVRNEKTRLTQQNELTTGAEKLFSTLAKKSKQIFLYKLLSCALCERYTNLENSKQTFEYTTISLCDEPL